MLDFPEFKSVFKDRQILVFGLNCLFVVLSYYIKNKFDPLYSIFFAFKGVFLGLSLLSLVQNKMAKINDYKLFIYFTFFILSILFSSSLSHSINRSIPYILGFSYIYFFVNYLRANYDIKNQIIAITTVFLLVYGFPMLTSLININVIISEGFVIYGKDSMKNSTGFLSNNLGWSSVIFLGSFLTIITNFKFAPRQLIFWSIIAFFSLFLLAISGSRSGLLCISLIIFSYVLKVEGRFGKYFILLMFVGLVYIIINSDFFSFTDTRLISNDSNDISLDKENEYRFLVLDWLFTYYNSHVNLWFTGIGFNQLGIFMDENAFVAIGDTKVSGDIHNSYLQMVFELGIFTFSVFLFLFVLPAFYNLVRSDLVVFGFIPSLVIPYFENNLNSGQFLFFPFVFSLIYLSYDKIGKIQ
jgi:hypothetical protein